MLKCWRFELYILYAHHHVCQKKKIIVLTNVVTANIQCHKPQCINTLSFKCNQSRKETKIQKNENIFMTLEILGYFTIL